MRLKKHLVDVWIEVRLITHQLGEPFEAQLAVRRKYLKQLFLLETLPNENNSLVLLSRVDKVAIG